MKINKIKGFTLVELLAVIAVIGLILIIAVPKITSVIENSKKKTLELTAKSIAKSAEEKIIENDTFDIGKEITCDSISDYSSDDFSLCTIKFDEEGKAIVSIVGAGSYEGFNICNGTKIDANATNDECELSDGGNEETDNDGDNNGLTAATYIEELLAQEETLHNGLVQTYATVNGEQVDAGIRYVGSAPNNKVYFNCKDAHRSNSKTIKYGDKDYLYKDYCETWRIIGVFDVDNGNGKLEKRVKIVRDPFSKEMSWDSSSNGGGTDNNSGGGINQWGDIKENGNTIYDGADLMRMLNGYYILESNVCTYCTSSNQGTCPASNDCSSFLGQLSITSIELVDDALWYTGSVDISAIFPLSTMYEGERGTQNGRNCTLGNSCNDNVERTTTWVGKIGLIYPSDYAYASADASCATDIYGTDSTCNINNWLHPNSSSYWTITPSNYTYYANGIFQVSSSHHVDFNLVYVTHQIRPTLYLEHNVQIIGGDGTDGNEYILKAAK